MLVSFAAHVLKDAGLRPTALSDPPTQCGDPSPSGQESAGRQEVVMLGNRTKVLLILSQDVVDQARIVAGKATITLKLPVSLQIVLRALIEDGLKRDDHPTLLANVESQAKAVRRLRSVARQGGRAEGEPGDRRQTDVTTNAED